MTDSLDDGFEFFSRHEWVFGRLCNMCAEMKATLQSLQLESPEEVKLNTRKFKQQMKEYIEEELDRLDSHKGEM